MLFVIIGHDAPDARDKRPAVRPAHLAHLEPEAKAGRVKIAGPLLDRTGSLFIIEAASLADAWALVARDPFLFIVVWSVQHWSAAMGLASLVAAGGEHPDATRWQRLLAAINRRRWAVLLVLAAASALLLPVMEVEAVSDDYVYADRLVGDAAWWLRSSPFVPVLLALGFATGFIHYLLDRAAFRFSSPEVRKAARGLLS